MQVIAYYLPQYHSIPENDAWWGKDFTEWTTVRNAKPLFKGHRQPVIPGELGYYNLLDPAIQERQAQLAREAGIDGFCYWHYWFGGKQLLEKPLEQVFQSGKPDFPFCIAWANESWYAKTWIDHQKNADRLLIEQTYPEGDEERHFEAILPMLRDKRIYWWTENRSWWFTARCNFLTVKLGRLNGSKWQKLPVSTDYI